VVAESDVSDAHSDADNLPPTGPLVFISHDSRDAELAEAFAKLIKSVSAGMIKTFRSSDRTGADGIDFGEQWFKRIMLALQRTTDVVCLFTERSVERPWILFEAGVAKGKLDTPVVGVALGISLNRVATGPFYQFQNMDDSEGDLTKLINQLARRVPGVELDSDVVKAQVAAFKHSEKLILEKIGGAENKKGESKVADDPVAKLVEEVKSLPSRIAEKLLDVDEPAIKRRRFRRFHPMLFDELLHFIEETGDCAGLVVLATQYREDFPWIYEIIMDAYWSIKSGGSVVPDEVASRVKNVSKLMASPFFEDMMDRDREQLVIIHKELPRMLERMLIRITDGREQSVRRSLRLNLRKAQPAQQ
jgi:hypothetical protein